MRYLYIVHMYCMHCFNAPCNKTSSFLSYWRQGQIGLYTKAKNQPTASASAPAAAAFSLGLQLQSSRVHRTTTTATTLHCGIFWMENCNFICGINWNINYIFYPKIAHCACTNHYNIEHFSEIRSLCLMKWPGGTLQNLPYFGNVYEKPKSLFPFFI